MDSRCRAYATQFHPDSYVPILAALRQSTNELLAKLPKMSSRMGYSTIHGLRASKKGPEITISTCQRVMRVTTGPLASVFRSAAPSWTWRSIRPGHHQDGRLGAVPPVDGSRFELDKPLRRRFTNARNPLNCCTHERLYSITTARGCSRWVQQFISSAT